MAIKKTETDIIIEKASKQYTIGFFLGSGIILTYAVLNKIFELTF